MASPPYSYSPTALSPTPSQSYGNNKKRASEAGMAPSLKRRKASAMSVGSATHPLRQTSFPPDESQSFYDMGARSPSVDSMSLVSGMGGGGGGSQVGAANALPVKKKRGRKSKAEKAAMREREQTPSVAGGVARTVVSGISDARGRSRAPGTDAAADEEDENIELDRADVQVAATAQETTAEQKQEENKLKNMLVSGFSEAQFDRYSAWRASGFSKSTVRKVSLRQTCLL
jgi:transcription initiation factor TFIID subunit 11